MAMLAKDASPTSQPEWAGEMRYVARQPILDVRGHVHAYELLFRTPPHVALNPDAVLNANDGSNPTADSATRTMLDNAVIFGLDWLTNGLPAFVCCTEEALTEDLVLVLPPDRTVLGIPGSLECSPRLVSCCRNLKSRGFRLSLDDFPWTASWLPLAEMADYLRVDFNRFGHTEREYLRRLDLASPAMIGKNVDTQDDYSSARSEGFTLYQGSYFCHPLLLKKRKLPANRLLHFDIVRHLLRDPINLHEVSQVVLRDAALTYRLLRLANSPMYAMQREVRSIESAIMAVGENAFRRIVSLAVLSEMGEDAPPEILHMTLVRARFCELAANSCGLDPSEQYLLGMMSLVPAMLCLPIEELTPSLPLRAEICEALLGAQNSERNMLTWLECHERGDWETCDAIAQAGGLTHPQLMQWYADSMVWAVAALKSAV